jgi:hypothetical protein
MFLGEPLEARCGKGITPSLPDECLILTGRSLCALSSRLENQARNHAGLRNE